MTDLPSNLPLTPIDNASQQLGGKPHGIYSVVACQANVDLYVNIRLSGAGSLWARYPGEMTYCIGHAFGQIFELAGVPTFLEVSMFIPKGVQVTFGGTAITANDDPNYHNAPGPVGISLSAATELDPLFKACAKDRIRASPRRQHRDKQVAAVLMGSSLWNFDAADGGIGPETYLKLDCFYAGLSHALEFRNYQFLVDRMLLDSGAQEAEFPAECLFEATIHYVPRVMRQLQLTYQASPRM